MWAEAVRSVDVLAAWLLTYLVHSTALVGAAWLVTRVVRLQPVTRDFLWRAALLGGVVTATGALVTPPPRVGDPVRLVAGEVDVHRIERIELGGDVRGEIEETIVARRPVRWQSTPAQPGPLALEGRLSTACRDELRAGPGAPDPTEWIGRVERLCESRATGWRVALVGVWLAGAVLALVGLARGYGALRGLSGTLSRVEGRTLDLLGSLVERPDGVRMAASAELSAPCVLPGGTIGLPVRCEEELTDGELRAVLAHELAHVQRRDVAWAALLRCVSAALWVQPLNRLALTHAREATEEACDDWALSRTGEPFGLATSISRVAAWVSGAPEPPLAVSMVGRGGGAIAARVSRVLSGGGRADPRWKRFLFAALIALPLPLLPAARPPGPARVAVFVQERSLDTVLHPADAAVPDSIHARVVVARFMGS